MRQPGHRFVGDQQFGLCRHGAGKLELAPLDLSQITGIFCRICVQSGQLEHFHAPLVRFRLRYMMSDARGYRVKQRHADIVSDAHAHEWPRQLKATGKTTARAFVGDQTIHLLAGEGNAAALVMQGAADTVDQRALAGPVGADQADTLAVGYVEVDRVERDEAAETLAQLADLQQRLGHDDDLLLTHFCHSPTMPFGATMTKPIRSRPTISRFTADEIVTVATCCSVPRRIAPIKGPAQDVVPPIMGMAIELTA